jgi:hypothetical protein
MSFPAQLTPKPLISTPLQPLLSSGTSAEVGCHQMSLLTLMAGSAEAIFQPWMQLANWILIKAHMMSLSMASNSSFQMFALPLLVVSWLAIMQGECYLLSSISNGWKDCRAIHCEQQPHKYAISWTTSRNKGQEYGGGFYLAQYGIQVVAAANTFIVWRNHDAHGTGLQKIDPTLVHSDEDPNSFCQAGLAFVTPNRLQKAWMECLQGIIDESKVWEVLQADDEEAEIEYNWDDDEEWTWELHSM